MVTYTWPPGRLYFTPLSMRFMAISRSMLLLPRTLSSVSWQWMVTCLSLQKGSMNSTTDWISPPRGTASCMASAGISSIRDRKMMLLIISSSRAASFRISWPKWAMSSFFWYMPAAISSANPLMEVRGVFSSWVTLAVKSLRSCSRSRASVMSWMISIRVARPWGGFSSWRSSWYWRLRYFTVWLQGWLPRSRPRGIRASGGRKGIRNFPRSRGRPAVGFSFCWSSWNPQALIHWIRIWSSRRITPSFRLSVIRFMVFRSCSRFRRLWSSCFPCRSMVARKGSSSG